MVQSVLTGKGTSAYLARPSAQSSNYALVKKVILDCYQLTPEFYRAKFRNTRKEPSQTSIEYAHTVNKLFERWLAACNVTTFEKLKELIVLEQFFRGISQDV